MSIEAVIFDLDGVLIESTKELHFKALNKALKLVSSKYTISKKEHLEIYDALSTNQKLKLLTKNKGLPKSLYRSIWENKQKFTLELLEKLNLGIKRRSFFSKLKNDGYKVAVCTNSIKETAHLILNRLGILDMVDVILTNEDVVSPKPSPEMYIKAQKLLGVESKKCLIVEDSAHGLLSARDSGAVTFKVKSARNTYYDTRKVIVIANKLSDKFIFREHGTVYPYIEKCNFPSGAGYYSLFVKCNKCKKSRMVEYSVINRSKFTGMCLECAVHMKKPSISGKNNVNYKGILYTTGGYVLVNLEELSQKDREFAKMLLNKGDKPNRISQHRFVMAKHLNRRLKDYEIVHHKNGVKTDNRLENLELLTTKSHHAGHGDFYYQKWQEAESKIVKLENKLKMK